MLTQSSYLDELHKIREKIEADETEGMEEKLQELYQIKPVRLEWFVTTAWLWWKQGRKDQICKLFLGRTYYIEDYSGMYESFEFWKKVTEEEKNTVWEKRIDAMYSRILKNNIKLYDNTFLTEAYQNYLQEDTQQNLYNLMNAYLSNYDDVIYQLLYYQLLHTGFLKEESSPWYAEIHKLDINADYLKEKVMNSRDAFIVIQNEKNQEECDVIISVLNHFDHSVYLLMAPIESNEISVEWSLQNTECYPDAVCIPTQMLQNGNDSRGLVLEYLCSNILKNGYGVILAAYEQFKQFLTIPVLQKQVECLSFFQDVFKDKMNFGWIGNYMGYCNDLYCYNIEKELQEKLERPAKFDFSIVIPARNSAGTLYYTLQTCLNQDYKGSYEIIVSDNSTEEYHEVYRVCQDIKDSRIHYVKTPRNLVLSKSFEYAVLQAQGEFIFTLGSDDGVCPWALSRLKKVLDKYPGEEVLQWKRGYYVWEDYPGRKANEFVIPGQFDFSNINVHYETSLDYFARTLKYSFNMYSLPTMYVNSGFRRTYLKTLLEKTGRLWDGANQDLYIGIISAAINPQVLNIDYPLTVVGISSNSLGYLTGNPENMEETDSEQEQRRGSSFRGDEIGRYILQGIVRDIPAGYGESFSLYANLLRAIQLGVLPQKWQWELIDFKKVYTEYFEEHVCLDDKFDKLLHDARDTAKRMGKEFLTWFDNTIYNNALLPKYYRKSTEAAVKKRSYQEGIDAEGQLVLDASRYGVADIVEAVDLFAEMIDWTPENWKKKLETRKPND